MSEFGKGLCYSLGLFLAHAEKLKENIRISENIRKIYPSLLDTEGAKLGEEKAVELWFDGASDHLYELQIDAGPTKEINERLKILKDKCLTWKLPIEPTESPKKEDAYWAIQEAKDLLRLIDEAHNVPVEKGDWE